MYDADKHTTPRRPWSLRKKLLIFTPLLITILALALGLGLGLTIGRNNDDDDNNNDGEDAPPLPSPTTRLPWTPSINSTWQIVLQNRISLPTSASSITPDVDVYDVDLFETDKDTIATLHRLGKKVICYFSGGSYEPGRPDSGDFAQGDLGDALDGWPDERWVRLGSEGIRGIMKGRVELAHEKGCDGVDPDNVDGFQNSNGLGLTAQNSIDFMSYLSNLTAPFNLTLGLKNAGDIITQVLPIVHFSVNEECVKYKECSTFHKFIDAGKPVFHIEYPDSAGQKLRDDVRSTYCDTDGSDKGNGGFSTVLKNLDLDGWVEYCDGKMETTAMVSSGGGGKE